MKVVLLTYVTGQTCNRLDPVSIIDLDNNSVTSTNNSCIH